MLKKRIQALSVIIIGLCLGYFIYSSDANLEINRLPKASIFSNFPFKLGLDLSGGTHLVYRADLTNVKAVDVANSISALRDVIERRVNLFGVAEPVVQNQEFGFAGGKEERLIVDLPGVTDIDKAVAMIGQTPLLEFKVERPDGKEKDELVKKAQDAEKAQLDGKTPDLTFADPYYVPTELTGRFLQKAEPVTDQTTYQPMVSLVFNTDGADLFKKITKENIGKTVAIYLDGAPISAPVVREEISGGKAQISGNFTRQEVKTLVGRLNSGALPVPIELISTQTIGASLGTSAIDAGVKAGLISLLIISLFFLFWYRLPGILAIVALAVYLLIMLSLFKLIPITLTAAGIAGFIISIGIAVDANVLIFERIKEEMRAGHTIIEAVSIGFKRAWFAIRDSNLTSIITATILFWFGTSSIQGFALVLGLGVLTSMLSAIIITKAFLAAFNFGNSKLMRFLFSSGITK